MDEHLEIRLARLVDAEDISTLIIETSLRCCFTDEQPCPQWYIETLVPDRIAESINDTNMQWYVAILDNKLIGVLALMKHTHVKYFFVAFPYHNKGIGRRIWQSVVGLGELKYPLSVNSSMNAVDFYERIGFKSVQVISNVNGLSYTKMVARK